MNMPRCTDGAYVDFLVASQGRVTCAEAARVHPDSPAAPAHDAFSRLLDRLEPDPEALWREAQPLVPWNGGVPVLDDTTLDKPYAEHIALVTRHWSGKHKRPVRGINLITVLWTDGDRTIPVDSRIYSQADGTTKHDHFVAMLLLAKARGFAPEYVLFDGWYASLENLKPVRGLGWRFLTRIRGDRIVTPGDRISRPLDAVAISASGTAVHLRGYGMVLVFRIDTPDGDAESGMTNDLAMDAGARRHYAEVSFAIESYHRERKQNCGVEGCQGRSERAQRNHIGCAIRAFLRLEWHFFTTGVSGYMLKSQLVLAAIRHYLANPWIRLPEPSTA